MKLFTPLFFLPNFWYPIGKKFHIGPTEYEFCNAKYVVYRNKQNQTIIHTDICPHQGA